MEINTKTIIGAGVVIALGAVGFMMWKKNKSKKDFTMPPITGGGGDVTTDPAEEPIKQRELPEWSPEVSAQAIYDSMKGAFYTDEDLFFNTAEGLTSDQRNQVKNYFNSNLGDGSSLCEWIEGDFMYSDEDKALALFGYPTGAYWSNC